MKVLVINCGSSSLKYQLIDMDGEVMWLRHVWWVWLLLGLLPIGA